MRTTDELAALYQRADDMTREEESNKRPTITNVEDIPQIVLDFIAERYDLNKDDLYIDQTETQGITASIRIKGTQAVLPVVWEMLATSYMVVADAWFNMSDGYFLTLYIHPEQTVPLIK